MSFQPPVPDQISAANSSTTPLSANATFTGTAVDCTAQAISSITATVFSDQASALGGMQLQWSQDGSNWGDHNQVMTNSASASTVISDKVRARYFRIVYVNGTVNQTAFRLQTLLSATNTSGTIRDLDTGVNSDDEAQQVRAVLTGKTTPGSKYTDVITDVYGSLQTVVGGQAADAFGRLRIGNPVSLFGAQFQYTNQPLIFQNSVVGTGTVAKTANESSLTLSTGGTASGASAVNQSKQYLRYEPGKSQQILMTGVLGVQKNNVRSRIGYFDANDGVYFEMDGGAGASVNVRSSVSGSPLNTTITQANWNFDTMDGTGPSGITLDFSKAQIFAIDFQWLGEGRVRFGFFVNGVLLICHQFYAANIISTPYMNTANLPVRAEITNTGTAASSTSMKQVCMAVVSEGGVDNPQSYHFTASNGVTSVSVTTRRAILSIRPKATFGGITNRVVITPEEAKVLCSSGSCFWELVYNGALGGAPSFTSVDANSTAEFDVAGTTVTGGTVVASGFASGGGDTARGTTDSSLLGVLPVTLDITGATQDVLSLVVTAFTGSVLANGALRWEEIR